MKRYGLIGRTLKHSFSQSFFTKKFAEEGITDSTYENFELKTIEAFPALFSTYTDIKGVNVTIPYKEEVLPFLTEVDEVVEKIGACNCIRIAEGKLKGFNTDVVGFRTSLEPKLKSHHQNALVLGTGGASKAICYVLEQLGIEYKLVSRQRKEDIISYMDLGEEMIRGHQLIINTTPLGMYPHVDAEPDIPYQYITSEHFLFDIIYNPEKTNFLAEGEKRGAQICNGHEMLIGQAVESWRIWTE